MLTEFLCQDFKMILYSELKLMEDDTVFFFQHFFSDSDKKGNKLYRGH